MRKPEVSLEDYEVKPPTSVQTEPPTDVSLRGTGEIERLKPLVRSSIRIADLRRSRYRMPQPLWFRRFIAVGGGALVMIALALVSAIIIGINEPTPRPEVAI